MADNLPSWEPNWKRRYNSPPDDLISDFYVPAFARAYKYDRAVGFFSSRLLAEIAPSIDEFTMNGGTMRLITSPAQLSDEDLEAMGKGAEVRTRLRKDLEDEICGPIPNPILLDRLKLLAWMVATGKLEIRIALREHPSCYSLFHEKIGVFTDDDGNWMTFTGSPNETIGGARRHSESFPLHRSWASEDQYAFATEERDRVESIWSATVEGITTWTVNEWIEEPMRRQFGVREPGTIFVVPKPQSDKPIPLVEDANPPMALSTTDVSLLPSLPNTLELRPYQRDAVNDWLKANGRGTFAMATGTGKTVTALAAVTQASLHAARLDSPLLVLVCVPSIDLVEQWREGAEWFGFRPAVCHGNLTTKQRNELKAAFSAARATHGRRTEMIITTAGSLTPQGSVSESEHFLQRQLERHRGQLLFIGDEMHSLGTEKRLKSLPRNATFTLGLSATPKRHGDEVGTESLLAYFGDPVVSISIKEAIYHYGALVEYDYHPHRIELTIDEAERYRAISARIAAAFAARDDERADREIRARTRLTQHAANKQVQLRQLMADGLRNETHQIIYVAEGKNPETELQQLDETERMLRDEFGMRVDRYYGKTDSDRREVLQRRLADGEIQALLAMKCLDEGVDIPSARIGIITASTQNPRQFVQRRGRLLRHDPVNPKSHAVIFDFIVVPPRAESSSFDSEKTLIGAELSRAVELADAARNREVLFHIIEWAYDYGLDSKNYPWMTLSEDGEMEEWVQ
jgi:superfamily II DNA or RNA helicase